MCHLRSDIWQFIFSKSKDLSAAISGCPDSQAGLQSFDVTTNFPSLWMCVCNCGHVHICAGDIELLSRLSSSWSQYQGCDWHDCQCRKPSWQDGQVGHCFGSQGEGNDQESRSAAGRSWQVVAVRPAIGHFQSPAFWNTSGKGSRQREHKPNAHGRRDTAWCWRLIFVNLMRLWSALMRLWSALTRRWRMRTMLTWVQHTVPVPKNSRRKQLALSSEADPGCAKGPPVKKTKAKAKAKTVNKTPKEKIAPKKVTQEEKKRCPKVPNKNGKKDSEDQDSKDDHQGKDLQETHALAKKPKKNATAKAKARNLREPRAGKGELKRPAASKERGSKKAHGSANSKEDAEVTIKKKMHSAPWQTIVWDSCCSDCFFVPVTSCDNVSLTAECAYLPKTQVYSGASKKARSEGEKFGWQQDHCPGCPQGASWHQSNQLQLNEFKSIKLVVFFFFCQIKSLSNITGTRLDCHSKVGDCSWTPWVHHCQGVFARTWNGRLMDRTLAGLLAVPRHRSVWPTAYNTIFMQ